MKALKLTFNVGNKHLLFVTSLTLASMYASSAIAPTMDAGVGGSFPWPHEELSLRKVAWLRPNSLL